MIPKRAIWMLSGVAILLGVAAVPVLGGLSPGAGRDAKEAGGSVTRRGQPPAARDAPIFMGSRFDSDAPLAERVEMLEREVARLHRELGALRVRSRLEGGARTAAVERDGGELREQVSAVLAEEREAQQQRRIDRMQDRLAERIEGALAELTARGGLSAEQLQAVTSAWTAEGDRIGELLAEVRAEGGGFREVREQVRDVRRETDARVEASLTQAQVEAYRDIRNDRWPGGGGREQRDEVVP